jgi:putative transcriptional regulator
MMPKHHLGDDLLIAYAAGSQEEPLALVVATHLALCPRCRQEVDRLENLGGVLLEEQETEALAEGSLGRVLARLDDAAPEAPAPLASAPAPVDLRVPRPLRDYLGADLEQLDWISYGGLDKAELLPEADGFRTRLMRIRPGTAMPAHTRADPGSGRRVQRRARPFPAW